MIAVNAEAGIDSGQLTMVLEQICGDYIMLMQCAEARGLAFLLDGEY